MSTTTTTKKKRTTEQWAVTIALLVIAVAMAVYAFVWAAEKPMSSAKLATMAQERCVADGGNIIEVNFENADDVWISVATGSDPQYGDDGVAGGEFRPNLWDKYCVKESHTKTRALRQGNEVVRSTHVVLWQHHTDD